MNTWYERDSSRRTGNWMFMLTLACVISCFLLAIAATHKIHIQGQYQYIMPQWACWTLFALAALIGIICLIFGVKESKNAQL